MPDVWTKYSNEYTTTGIHFLDEKITEKQLPYVTLCPWSSYKEGGFHYSNDSYQTQTYQVCRII